MKRLSLFWRMYLGFLLALLLPVGLFELSALGARQRFHDEMVRGLTRGVLESRGYHVLEVANGGEALLVCEQREGSIDLVVTDVVMPGLSGPDLVRRLDVVRPGLKVLFCSGYTSGAIQHAEALGSGRAFLQKPFTPDALVRKVREVLDGSVAPTP